MIVFDIKSYRTLASMLGGGEYLNSMSCLLLDQFMPGDYDGDKVIAIWQPEIVAPFKNADPNYANPPGNFKEQFSKNNETVRQLRGRLVGCDEAKRYMELQKYLLGPLRDPSIVGRYSNMHDCATYMLGYRSAVAVRLAYMYVVKIFQTVFTDMLTKVLRCSRWVEDGPKSQAGGSCSRLQRLLQTKTGLEGNRRR